MAGKFYYRLYLTEVDKDRAKELRVVLGRIMRGTGKALLTDMIRRVIEGETILVYQTNDVRDAEDKADVIRRGGGQVKIVGL